MLLADGLSGGVVDNEGIKALLRAIADNHPWNQTWWGQLVMFGLTWIMGAAFGWAAGRFNGFKAGIRSERDRPAELTALPPATRSSLPAPDGPRAQ